MVVPELGHRMSAYIEAGKNRSLHRLAKDSGVSYITCRRIIQGEVNTVALENAIALLTAMGETDSSSIFALVEAWYPEGGRIIREFNEKIQGRQCARQDLTDMIADFAVWLTVCLAERPAGVKRDHLVEILGKKTAESAIKKLDEVEVVEDRGTMIELKDKDFATSGNPEFILNEIAHMTKVYEVARRSQPGHLLSSVVTGLNQSGLERLRAVLKQAAMDVAEIASNSRYKGEQVAFCGLISGTIMSDEVSQ
ncbi:MAG: hypothetical protein FJ146_19155 [Deltaproteobacteria bacterium]|nr:hypothetical protein [Deltaproteobacteria bacterium]